LQQARACAGANDALVDPARFAVTKGSVLVCLDEATGQRLWRLVIPRLRTLYAFALPLHSFFYMAAIDFSKIPRHNIGVFQ